MGRPGRPAWPHATKLVTPTMPKAASPTNSKILLTTVVTSQPEANLSADLRTVMLRGMTQQVPPRGVSSCFGFSSEDGRDAGLTATVTATTPDDSEPTEALMDGSPR